MDQQTDHDETMRIDQLEAECRLLRALLRSKAAPYGRRRFVGGEYPDEP